MSPLVSNVSNVDTISPQGSSWANAARKWRAWFQERTPGVLNIPDAVSREFGAPSARVATVQTRGASCVQRVHLPAAGIPRHQRRIVRRQPEPLPERAEQIEIGSAGLQCGVDDRSGQRNITGPPVAVSLTLKYTVVLSCDQTGYPVTPSTHGPGQSSFQCENHKASASLSRAFRRRGNARRETIQAPTNPPTRRQRKSHECGDSGDGPATWRGAKPRFHGAPGSGE